MIFKKIRKCRKCCAGAQAWTRLLSPCPCSSSLCPEVLLGLIPSPDQTCPFSCVCRQPLSPPPAPLQLLWFFINVWCGAEGGAGPGGGAEQASPGSVCPCSTAPGLAAPKLLGTTKDKRATSLKHLSGPKVNWNMNCFKRFYAHKVNSSQRSYNEGGEMPSMNLK